MRITDVKSYPVWVGHRNLLIIKVDTDEGVFGIGEAGLSGRELAVIGAVSHFREFLIGRDPMQIGRIWQELYRSQYYEGGRVLLAAQSAIDIALYDLVGKTLGVPIYQLLGGKHRDLVPCFPTASGGSGEEMLESVERLWSQGWRVIRTAVARAQDGPADIFEPRESIPRMAEWLVKIRETIGSELTLGIDYHHRLSVAETASFCQRMPTGTLDFLEEPIRAETPGAYEALRAMVDVPFAIGEEFASKWDFLPFIEQHLTDFARVDICIVGGFTESMKVASWAEAHYIDLMPHNPLGPICTAASVHLAAAVPNFSWLEIRLNKSGEFFYDKTGDVDLLFPVHPQLTGTGIAVSDAPGLGVAFDEELAKSQEWRFWEAPHLRRGDGSVTNW